MDAILLAAGNSIRFGENKLLYPLNGKPMYQHILGHLYELKAQGLLEHVIVVSQYEEVFSGVRDAFPGIETVCNPDPGRGISSSIRLGVERLERISEKSESCLFAVADQPFLTEGSIRNLIRFYREHDWENVAAAHDGCSGNPVIFHAKYYEELKCLTGDAGGKRVLRSHMETAGFCEIPAQELEDLDTKAAALNIQEMPDARFPFLKENGHVISLVGAGGKTTLMYALAGHCVQQGKRVVVMTTTHIRRPAKYPVAETREELNHCLEKYHMAVAGADAPDGKLKSVEQMDIGDYIKAADIVLVEADGAKHFPCKVPLDTEPVIPAQSDIVLGVMGMDALGKPMEDVCFRAERAMELLGVKCGHRMTERDMAAILSADWGTRKNVGSRDYYAVLNKCDDALRMEQAGRICRLLVENGIQKTVCISLQREAEVSATEERKDGR